MKYLYKACFVAPVILVLSFSPGYPQHFHQDKADFIAVDQHAFSAPDSLRKSVEKLSAYLVMPYQSDSEKVRSIYTWIVQNLRYDHRRAAQKHRKRVSLMYVLKVRRAICGDYAALFKALCDAARIPSVVIEGYSRYHEFRDAAPFTAPDHAWNAVQLEGNWYLLDATWESKMLSKTKPGVDSRYFLSDPQTFILDHLPANPMWQLLLCPISIEDYKKKLTDIKQLVAKPDTCYHHADSLKALFKLLPPDRELKLARDAHRYNPRNHETIGFGLMNYGYYISINNYRSQDAPIVAISTQKKALSYYQEALKHLRRNNNSRYVTACKKHIRYVKSKIKSLKKRQMQTRSIRKSLQT